MANLIIQTQYDSKIEVTPEAAPSLFAAWKKWQELQDACTADQHNWNRVIEEAGCYLDESDEHRDKEVVDVHEAAVVDVCIAGSPAVNGICGDPECVCASKPDQGVCVSDEEMAEEYNRLTHEQKAEVDALPKAQGEPNPFTFKSLDVTPSELATILHALRVYQDDRHDADWYDEHDCEHFAAVPPLTDEQIDALCDRLNFTESN